MRGFKAVLAVASILLLVQIAGLRGQAVNATILGNHPNFQAPKV